MDSGITCGMYRNPLLTLRILTVEGGKSDV
jgi:hypothetical protein